MTIREGVDEIGCIVANITLNLYCGGLQEVERLEVALPEDKTAYRGSVRCRTSKNSARRRLAIFRCYVLI